MVQRIVTGLTTLIVLAVVVGVEIIGVQGTITGKWLGETNAGAKIVLDVVAEGATLMGTLTRNDETTRISDDKVSKNTFTFNAVLGGQPESISGEVAGDEVKAWLVRQGPETAIVLKRVKN